MQTPLSKQTLFWDSDLSTIDPTKHARFIIERIFARGDIDDVRWMKETYPEDTLKKAVVDNRTLDKKSQNFWCQYFNINKNLCIRNQLSHTQSPFWTK